MKTEQERRREWRQRMMAPLALEEVAELMGTSTANVRRLAEQLRAVNALAREGRPAAGFRHPSCG